MVLFPICDCVFLYLAVSCLPLSPDRKLHEGHDHVYLLLQHLEPSAATEIYEGLSKYLKE